RVDGQRGTVPVGPALNHRAVILLLPPIPAGPGAPAGIGLFRGRSTGGQRFHRQCSSDGRPCRHRSLTSRRNSLRMSRASGGHPVLGNGTPEQVHLTWGDDPATSVVLSWTSPARAVRPSVRIGQRVILARERAFTVA